MRSLGEFSVAVYIVEAHFINENSMTVLRREETLERSLEMVETRIQNSSSSIRRADVEAVKVSLRTLTSLIRQKQNLQMSIIPMSAGP